MGLIRVKEIPLLPSNWTLDIIWGGTKKQAAQYMNRRYGAGSEYYEEKMRDKTSFFTVVSATPQSLCRGESRPFIYLHKWSELTIVHELVHALWGVAWCVGYEMNDDTQEWQAVLYEYLYKHAIDRNGYKDARYAKVRSCPQD